MWKDSAAIGLRRIAQRTNFGDENERYDRSARLRTIDHLMLPIPDGSAKVKCVVVGH